MDFDQLVKYRTSGSNERQKINIKRCLKGAERSRFHYTREEALRAFVYRKMFQLERIRLTAETVQMCLVGLRKAGMIAGEYRCTVEQLPGDYFLAAPEPGPIASTYNWGEY
ncbi:hypothetical protein ACRS85_23320 [Pluralibacter gergoviae]|uniref:hypothetical protein n=1 Tax=Pluralibacter gergoviae TaxID=61647 RepID=UPI003EE3067B